MIENTVLVPADMLATEINSKGQCMYAKEGTPLGEMLATLNTMNERTNDVISEISKASIPLNKDNADRYELLKNKFIQAGTDRMNAIVNFTRNYINPIIREVLEGVDGIRNSLETDAASANTTVRSLSMPRILQSGAVDQLLMKAEPRSPFSEGFSSATFRELWSEASVADILKTCETSFEAFNEEFKEFVSLYYVGDSLKSVDFAGKKDVPVRMTDYFEMNHDLVCVLFISGVIQGRHPQIPFEELNATDQVQLKKLLNFWQGRLQYRINRCVDIQKQKEVILSTDEKNNIIYVLKDNYTAWLNEGGSADALIGYWLSTGKSASARNADIALANKDRFIENFGRQQKNALRTSMLEFNQKAERYVVEQVVARIRKDVEDTQRQKELVIKANKFFSKMGIRDFADGVDEYTRFMVCKTLGADSDSLDILNSINSYKKDNPDATMDEAVTDAISERLAKWLADQIILVDDKADLSGARFA